MRHHDVNRKFGRPRRQRTALIRGLARSLVVYERITTTEAKAKELRPYVEKLVTKAKNDTLANRRLITAEIGLRASKKMVESLGEKYEDRSGGYTRIVKLSPRKSDASKMAVIEFV